VERRYCFDAEWEWNLVFDEVALSDDYYRLHAISQRVSRSGGELLADAVHPEDASVVDAAVRRAIKDRQDCFEVVFRSKTSPRAILRRGLIDVDQHGAPWRVIGIDIELRGAAARRRPTRSRI
jgi:hypothetical protein